MPAPSSTGRPGWCVYLVACSDGSWYAGVTNDLPRRLDQHNRGVASRYTRARLPVRLLYHERCPDRPSALRIERRIKSLSRPAKEAYVAARTGTPPQPR